MKTRFTCLKSGSEPTNREVSLEYAKGFESGKAEGFESRQGDFDVLQEIVNHQDIHIASLSADVEKLQDFKDFVHRRLDKAGIPTHPDGPHSKEGCRIGDRLDIALNTGSLTERYPVQ